MTRQELSAEIAKQLRTHKDELAAYWRLSGPVRHFYLDGLLPEDWAEACFNALPDPGTLMLRSSIKEHKHVGIDLDKYKPLVGDILLAFHDAEVVKIVSEITAVTDLVADGSLYGSGVSMMLEGDFLLPHLDNSHDGDGELYRVLNALYYITPNWPDNSGGNLELWDTDMKERKEIHANFNRLIMMETNTHSIHSVNKVTAPGVRACISNYYFSATPVEDHDYVHKTTFYARPEDDILKKVRLTVEGKAKNLLSKYLDNKTTGTKHRRKQ
ncbi:MAG: 2OG-Fe(II) oxygenase [Flavipsychrobacter sp.]|nr:2OG-Fe(II) oxygenase [Flavipsychrobacter sp.]